MRMAGWGRSGVRWRGRGQKSRKMGKLQKGLCMKTRKKSGFKPGGRMEALWKSTVWYNKRP